ncbi:MAG TPA: hypothetical protein VNR51_07630 [Hyphomicrobium sp.]|nr:hypothetical protein [Hyphomicrobium sp.]
MDWIDRKAFLLYEAEVEAPATAVASVDIFDTLLLRGLKPEPHRFLDMARRQLRVLRDAGHDTGLDARALMQVRLEAAGAAYRHCPPVRGVREATYTDIAGTMLHLLGLPADPAAVPGIIARLLEAELDYEITVLRPNPLLTGILERARKAGRRVICISDMYLPAETLRRLVDRHVPTGLVERVYSSADFGFSKASGLLYGPVLDDLGAAPEAVAHCGDNEHADVRQARAAGIRAVHVPRRRPWLGLTGLWKTTFHGLHGIAA